MIFKSEVSDLVYQIEQEPFNTHLLSHLISLIKTSLQDFQEKRNKLQKQIPSLQKYPIIDNFALSFDPLIQSHELVEAWYEYGFVVGKNVCYNKDSHNTIQKIHSVIDSFNIKDESSYIKDNNGTPIISRGFFEIYHDDCLAQIRQNIRLYLYHCLLWNTPYLWTSFDRLGLKTPSGENSIGLNLHVDQNPTVHPNFTTIQGVLALDDCPIERGTFVVVPGSVSQFHNYSQFVKPRYKGEFVPLEDSYLKEELQLYQQLIPLQKNNIVSWDSRTTHANSSNISDINRYVCYVSTGIAKNERDDLIQIRKNAFNSGLGENTRDAYLHASKKPRFTNQEFIAHNRTKEILTPLGECLYGFKKYEDLK